MFISPPPVAPTTPTVYAHPPDVTVTRIVSHVSSAIQIQPIQPIHNVTSSSDESDESVIELSS